MDRTQEPLLASKQDVEGLLGKEIVGEDAERLDGILAKLSELFRRESGQHFTEKRSHVRRKVNGGELFLPQAPVIEVHSVTTLAGHPVKHRHIGGQIVYVPGWGSHAMLLVDYSHGGPVPDLVRSTVADAARQVLMIDPAAVGGLSQQQETTGPFTGSTSYATWAQGGSTRLSPEDKAIAHSFRRRYGNVWVAG